MVTMTSPMTRGRCIWKNNGVCRMGSHAHMGAPPYFATPYAPLIVLQGPCKSLIKKQLWLTVNFLVLAPGGPFCSPHAPGVSTAPRHRPHPWVFYMLLTRCAPSQTRTILWGAGGCQPFPLPGADPAVQHRVLPFA